MSEEMISRAIKEKQVESDLRQIFEQTLPDKIRRHLDITPHPIIAHHHFSAEAAECVNSYRDGHFYGCIALTQAVTEALVRFLCERNSWKPKADFEKNVDTLHKRGFISNDIVDELLKIWEKRDDYHHLNSDIEQEQKQLELMTKEKLILLTKVEGDVFNFTMDRGRIVPTHLKYWNVNSDGTVPINLHCK